MDEPADRCVSKRPQEDLREKLQQPRDIRDESAKSAGTGKRVIVCISTNTVRAHGREGYEGCDLIVVHFQTATPTIHVGDAMVVVHHNKRTRNRRDNRRWGSIDDRVASYSARVFLFYLISRLDVPLLARKLRSRYIFHRSFPFLSFPRGTS